MTAEADVDLPIAAREIRRRFLLFFIPSVLQLALAFLTLPLTTMVLSPADFAAFSLVVSFSALAMSLSQMGSTFVLSRRFRGASHEEKCRLVTAMTALVLTSSVAFAGLFVAAFALAGHRWSFTAGISLTMIVLVVIESIGSSVQLLNRQTSRLGTAPGYYSLVAVLKNIASVAATLAALFLFEFKGMALFIGQAAGGVVALVGSLAVLSRFFRPEIDWEMVKEALHLGSWNTVSLLAQQGRQTAERMILSRFLGLYDLGIYVHAQQYQTIALLGAQPVQSAIIPVLLDEAKEKKPRFARAGRASTILFVGVTIFGVAAALFGRPVISLLTHDKFNGASPYVALLVAVVLIQLSGRPQFAALLLHGRGRYLCLCNVLGAVGATAVLLVLIERFGILAGVIASAVQFLIFRVATGFAPRVSAGLPFQDGWVVAGVAAITATVAGVEYFDPDLLTRALIFVAFLAVVLLFGRSAVADVIVQIQSQFGLGRGRARAQIPETVH